jgi:hypothetical protein
MVKIGQINLTQKFDDSGRNFYDVKDKMFMDFKKTDPVSAKIILDNADYREVKPLIDDVNAAIKKNDVPYTYPNKRKDITYDLSIEYSKRYLKKYLRKTPYLKGERGMEFNTKSSSGVIGKKTGFPKTAEYLNSKPFHEYKDDVNHIPPQLVNTKDEFLDLEADLKRNKVRLVDCIDKTFLYKQKILYDKQNKAFAKDWKNGYIKYGMVKQYGGLNLVVIDFENCCLIAASDCSGYDKCAVLTDIYEMRNENLIDVRDIMGDEYQDYINELRDYVTFYTLHPIRAHYNGDILLQYLSNSSGQNNTTVDNSILHVIIKFDVFINVYFEKFGRNPSYEEVMDNMKLAIYSDDKLFGIMFDFDVDRYIELEKSVYAKYGMVIKATASKAITHIPGKHFERNDIEFLGSTAVWSPEDDMYLPRPRIGKLCTSLSRVLTLGKELSRKEVFAKVFMIYSLLNDIDANIQESVLKYLNYIVSRDDNTDEDLDSFQQTQSEFDIKDFRDRSSFSYLMTGQQCAGNSEKKNSNYTILIEKPELFKFFFDSVGWMEGFIKIMRAVMAEKQIELDCVKVGCSESGIKYIKSALDPFNDIEVDCDGYPDRFTGKSVVQKIKTQYTLSVPDGVSGNWDANIYFDKVCSQHDINYFHVEQNNVDLTSAATPTNGSARGGVEARIGASGSIMDDSFVDAESSIALAIPSQYLANGGVRVIAMGFEVINSTAQINLQGNVITYRDNDNGDDRTVCNIYRPGTTTVLAQALAFRTVEAPDIPTTATEALNFYNSQKWEARKGCYCVSTLKQDGIPFEEFDSLAGAGLAGGMNSVQMPIGYYTQNVPNSGAITGGYSCLSTQLNSGNVFPTNRNAISGQLQRPMIMHQMNTSGAYFTGLSPTTTLDIVVHWILERAPNESNKDLVVLTRRSAGFDPKALELYGRIAGFLPPGVPRDDNDIGDWITEVADVLHEVGVPGMGLVKGAVAGGKMIYNAYNGLSNQNYNASAKASPGMTKAKKKQPQKQNPNKKTTNPFRRENAQLIRMIQNAPRAPLNPGQIANKKRKRQLKNMKRKVAKGGLFLG